ncbi:hypothetical protein D0C16_18570 [Cellvibrio sp. KY-GH-1]|nr:hypothetical protein D0C16_18570 [Cellvibrio sp. KY-GH-1]
MGPNIDKIDLAAVTPVTTTTTSLYYIHNDHLNTPQVITNQSQQVVWMANYEPFGKLAANQSNSIELFSRFPGQYIDPESGLYYNYFRDYDPSIGRYIESDPIGLEGGINSYAYVGGNPLILMDPLGLGPWDKLYGYPKEFWRWLHREDNGKLIKELKDPETGQVSKKDAKELYEQWKQDQGGFADPGILLDLLIPWYLMPTPMGCAELDCNHNGIPDNQEKNDECNI